jgi:hypothetical protein
LGSVKNISNDTVEVQDDFELLCWDFVSTPSTPGAFVSPINESTSAFRSVGNIQNKQPSPAYQRIDRLIHDILVDIK